MLGHWEIIVIILIALLIFGPKKIPELMRGLGKGIKEFKSSIKEDSVNDQTPRNSHTLENQDEKRSDDSGE